MDSETLRDFFYSIFGVSFLGKNLEKPHGNQKNCRIYQKREEEPGYRKFKAAYEK
jgi:hypothetical protein